MSTNARANMALILAWTDVLLTFIVGQKHHKTAKSHQRNRTIPHPSRALWQKNIIATETVFRKRQKLGFVCNPGQKPSRYR